MDTSVVIRFRDGPDEIIIREHAFYRLRERVGCSERKIQKTVTKAWNSVEPLLKGEIANRKPYEEKYSGDGGVCEYRKLMGRVYVFVRYKNSASGDPIVELKTVTPPARQVRRERKP